MTRIAEKLNLAYHGCKESEKPELFADVEQWLQEMDDRSGARPPVTHTGRGRCIHNVPICGECQTNHILAHVADIERAKNEVTASPVTPSDAAMRAAEETVELLKPGYPLRAKKVYADTVAAIITRHLAARPNDAEQEFLAASVAVWREIDRLSALPEGYKGLPPETDPRTRELTAWERYRAVLHAAATTSPETPVGGEHVDFVFDNTPCCKVCGLVRPAEGWTRPCKGPSELSLRAGESQ